jgi:glycosyltransferase involved in cell wall biosynthesis
MNRKVVHLVSSPATSGVTATIRLVATGLRDKGWEPVLVHYGQQDGIVSELLNEGISVHQIKAPPLSYGPIRTQWIISRLRKVLRKIDPCLVNAHSFDADLMAARALPAGGPPIIITSHSFSYVQWVKSHLQDYERWGKRFSILVPVCESLGNDILKIPAMSGMKMRVIFNVPDRRFFSSITISERNKNRALYGLNPTDVVIASVANFTPVKGHDILAEAFKLLVRKNPNLRLLMAGSAGPDPDRQLFQFSIRKTLKDEISRGQVIIIDPCNDARLVLSSADVYVQPSYTEALSVAIGEALASGLPVVATSVGGNPEIVVDGRTGLLVPPANPDLMANAIGNLLCDPILRRRLGDAAKTYALERLPSSSLLAAYDRCYNDLLTDQYNLLK